jgi:hypothetical protein
MKKGHNEGLDFARFIMVIASLAPAFIVVAFRGFALLCDWYLWGSVAILVIVPHLILRMRINTAKKNDDKKEIVVGKKEDQKDRILVYILTVMLPLFAFDLESWREGATFLFTIAFIVFLFYHANIYYMNIYYALCGYNIYTIYPKNNSNPMSGKQTYILLTKRNIIYSDDKIVAYRISNTVYMEVEDA